MNYLRFTLAMVIFPSILFSQSRVNSPDVILNEVAIGTLNEDIVGWSYSLDGKWIEGDKRVYTPLLSVQKEKLESEPYNLGIDNFTEISTHELYYGKDTLLLILKPFKDGYFKYPRSLTGWKNQKGLHYFIIERPKLNIHSISDTLIHSHAFRLRESGTIKDVSLRNAFPRILSRINLEERSNRYLYVDTQIFPSSCTIRFMLYANHEIFHDLQGTIGDLTKKGKSLFGTPQLLNNIYFEANLDAFAKLQLL